MMDAFDLLLAHQIIDLQFIGVQLEELVEPFGILERTVPVLDSVLFESFGSQVEQISPIEETGVCHVDSARSVLARPSSKLTAARLEQLLEENVVDVRLFVKQ